MHLGNAAALWLLPLVVIPLLLARRRRPAARVAVANLYLWKAIAERDNARPAMRRSRTTWLIALQMLCIGAIVTALARPAITFAAAGVTLVFDVSASMAARDGATTRMAEAHERARLLTAGLGTAARVRLVTAGTSPRAIGDFPAADPRLAAAIDAIAPTGGYADLAAAIALAAAAADAGDIVVLSDTLPGDATQSADTGKAGLRWERVGRPATNMAISRVTVRPASLGAAAGQLLVQVTNFSTEPRDAQVVLSSDGRDTGLVTLRVPAAGSQTVSTPVAALGRVVTARLTASDALDMDNVRSAVVPQSTPVRVALLGARGSFVEKALRTNPAVSLRTFERASRGDAGLAGGGFDVVVCDGCSEVPATGAASLLVLPRDGAPVHGPLTLATASHPVTARLDVGDQAGTVVTSAGVGAAADVLVRAGGVPAVTAYEKDYRRVVDIRLDVAAAEFPLSAAFPVLMANAIEWLAATGGSPTESVAGEPIAVASGIDPSAQRSSIVVIGPDGRRRATTRDGAELLVLDTAMPGIYRVQAGAAERPVAVNTAVAGESDLTAPVKGAAARQSVGDIGRAGRQVAISPLLALAALGLMTVGWRLEQVGAR